MKPTKNYVPARKRKRTTLCKIINGSTIELDRELIDNFLGWFGYHLSLTKTKSPDLTRKLRLSYTHLCFRLHDGEKISTVLKKLKREFENAYKPTRGASPPQIYTAWVRENDSNLNLPSHKMKREHYHVAVLFESQEISYRFFYRFLMKHKNLIRQDRIGADPVSGARGRAFYVGGKNPHTREYIGSYDMRDSDKVAIAREWLHYLCKTRSKPQLGRISGCSHYPKEKSVTYQAA